MDIYIYIYNYIIYIYILYLHIYCISHIYFQSIYVLVHIMFACFFMYFFIRLPSINSGFGFHPHWPNSMAKSCGTVGS